ncbi:uncharacterized protein HD556DRAFT_1397101 [Suillus plorans]|uniref:Translation machinery-associated protein 22 n=1 Tax=Suillus plorans TaxID=116603 RepID=A0A9P7DEN9_9AGAM|nr:uncharacterized protein HD556DRAFT_1397101 [Suillus plorans]KAG1789499.1 hypothetical protein HD556DRAFT_1397101 [Suillus plorans]
MFKKPLGNLKTSAPLRNSDRRKLKQHIVQTFALVPDVGEELVPEGLLSVKFNTYTDEPGVAYLGPGGDPLWFTLGIGSEDIIPTVYTLWKKPDLIPFLSTPSAVIPVLIGGADLMIPGVVQHPPSLQAGQLVSITEYIHHSTHIGSPLAVGHMAVDSDVLSEAGSKGKAVFVLHAWNDHLFDMGHKGNPPDPWEMSHSTTNDQYSTEDEDVTENDALKEPLVDALSSHLEQTQLDDHAPKIELTKEDVSSILHDALLQAMKKTLSSSQASALPMPASTFYSAYILPSRPAQSPSQPSVSTPIDIKHSTHKSLAYFLKSAEKQGLLKLKEIKSELMVFSVATSHADVVAHRPYLSLKDVALRNEKRGQREEEERSRVKELEVTELWKPHLQSLIFFAEAGFDTSARYTYADIKTVLDKYVTDRQLVNAHDQSYINVGADELLQTTLCKSDNPANMEFFKREQLIERLSDKMQSWYKICAEGKDPVLKKGQIKPISVVVKVRQGRKATTLITGFEPFLLEAAALAEELKMRCASSTSVSPAPGKSSGMLVLVQGKQVKEVTEFLTSQGVPKRWVHTEGGGKK